MSCIELTSSITVLANAMASKLNDDELAFLASVFMQLGDTLVTIATGRNLCSDTKQNCD